MQPIFSWSAVAGATSYDLWVNDASTGQQQMLRMQTAGTSVSALGAFAVGDSYQWWVRALNGTAGGTWSNTGSFTITPLSAPTLVGPSGLIQSSSVSFNWSAVSGATSYDLWVSDLTTNQATTLRNSSISTTSFNATLSAGHYYRWWVRALNTTGDFSNWSGGSIFSIALATPSVIGPSGALQTALPTFSWTTVPGATYYDLWVNDTTSGQSQVIRNWNITGTSFTPTSPLTPGDSYVWWLAAYVPGGLSTAWTASTTFTVTPLAPASPLTPTGPVTTAEPTFSWNAVGGADFYDVWVADVTANQGQVLRNRDVVGTTWTPSTPLTPGHQYAWWVRAVANNGDSGVWGSATAFTVSYLTAPVPINPSGPATAGFAWNAVAGADFYDLWVSDLTSGASQVLRNTHVAATSFTPVTLLPAGHTFQWWVSAFSNNGDYSAWSSASAPIKFITAQPNTISGTIFNDLNGDGTRQASEPGLLGWSVQLLNSGGSVVQTTSTDVSGNYSFTGIAAGTYTVEQVIATGWTQTAGSTSYSITVTSSTNSTGNNFGDHPPANNNVTIDAAWLAAQGSGPYILNLANTTYTLATDVDVPGTAFVIGAPNVVFNLNGHTVTYGDSAPIQVTNGGFEQGSGTNVPGWNLSAAPTASIMPARYGMWGNSMLEFSNFSTPQSIVSDPIAIPIANREYAATITPDGTFGTTVTLKVIDTVTGAVLGSGSSPAVNRGFGAVVQFTPITTDPVKLEVDLTPPAGSAATVDVDYAALFASRDYGIVASPSSWYFPTQLSTAAVTAVAGQVANFTVQNGSIVEGQGKVYSGTALNLWGLNGLTVNNVTTFVDGMDTVDLEGTYAGNISILNSTFNANIDNISDRMLDYAAIHLASNTGNIVITGNTILNYPQQGINISNNSGGNITISNNKIAQRAIVTDGYGIIVSGVTNLVIADNNITPVQGRGILLDSWNSAVSSNIDVYGNYVSVFEATDLEYGPTGMEATALRIRNWDGAQKNTTIHDNTFIATTGVGGDWEAIGMRVTQQNDIGQTTGDDLQIVNNIFEGIVTTTNTAYHAIGVSVSGVDPKTGLNISDNNIESNETSLNFGDNDSYAYHEDDMQMVGNTITQLSAGAARAYTSIKVGDWRNTTSNVRLIDTVFAGGATSAIDFVGYQPLDIETGFLLNVLAQNAAGVLPNAIVTVYNNAGTQVYTGTTDGTGHLNAIPLVTTTYTEPGTDPTAITTTSSGPFKVVVTVGGVSLTRSVDMTADQSLVFNF